MGHRLDTSRHGETLLDAMGDGVNIAARLEGICEPGGVCLISGTAYAHVRDRVDADFVDLGEKKLKNIARPVRVYRVSVDQGNSYASRARLAPDAA